MRANYDASTDVLTVFFKDAPVEESDEVRSGIILDFDASDNLVSIEVLDASKRVQDPQVVTVVTRH